MLKIKAEKMGELEKFGYSEHKDSYRKIYTNFPSAKDIDLYEKAIKDRDYTGIGIYVDKNKREVKVLIGYYDWLSRDIKHYIQDLIKADMVEVCDD